MTETEGPPWRPIATAVCDTRIASLLFRDGTQSVAMLYPDMDAPWWTARGATHWRDATEAERADFYLRHPVFDIPPAEGAKGAVLAAARRFAAYAAAHSVPGSRREELSDLIAAVDEWAAVERADRG